MSLSVSVSLSLYISIPLYLNLAMLPTMSLLFFSPSLCLSSLILSISLLSSSCSGRDSDHFSKQSPVPLTTTLLLCMHTSNTDVVSVDEQFQAGCFQELGSIQREIFARFHSFGCSFIITQPFLHGSCLSVCLSLCMSLSFSLSLSLLSALCSPAY